jgi:hypothetical protein
MYKVTASIYFNGFGCVEFIFPKVSLFSTFHSVLTGSGAHPSSYPMGTGKCKFPRDKRSGRQANHSPLSSAEVPHTSSWRGA